MITQADQFLMKHLSFFGDFVMAFMVTCWFVIAYFAMFGGV